MFALRAVHYGSPESLNPPSAERKTFTGSQFAETAQIIFLQLRPVLCANKRNERRPGSCLLCAQSIMALQNPPNPRLLNAKPSRDHNSRKQHKSSFFSSDLCCAQTSETNVGRG